VNNHHLILGGAVLCLMVSGAHTADRIDVETYRTVGTRYGTYLLQVLSLSCSLTTVRYDT
jgi:hypothetical protein